MSTITMDGYVRVSRVAGREGESYISPDVQKDAIRHWLDYEGIELGEWLVDEDWSGGTHDRPALKRGIQRALSGETTGIVSWKIDRFSRTTEDGLRDLRRLREADARLAFVVEDVDTGTTYGRMIYTILLAVGEAFLDDVKDSWRVAKVHAVERGAYISRTPFGFERREDGTLTPHAVQADIVREAFHLAAGEGGLTAAMEYLKQAHPERRWTTTKVRRLVSGRSYLGETANGEIRARDTHEALVDRRTWESAQSAPVHRASAGDFPLSGLLRCASCGSPMIGSRGGTGQRTYRCTATQSLHTGPKCTKGTVVTAERIETYAIAHAKTLAGGFEDRVTEVAIELHGMESRWREANDALNEALADATLRRILGDRYHQHIEVLVADEERSQASYQDACRLSAETEVVLSVDGLASDDPALVSAVLSGVFDEIVIRPGRGLKIEDRTRFVGTVRRSRVRSSTPRTAALACVLPLPPYQIQGTDRRQVQLAE